MRTASSPDHSRAILDSYIAQGYEIPEGYTAESIGELQAKWDIRPEHVPLCSVADRQRKVLAWGVPMQDGLYLRHTMSDAEYRTWLENVRAVVSANQRESALVILRQHTGRIVKGGVR